MGDIDDDAIIQFLARCSKAAVCDAKYGWFSANDFQTLTELIHCKFLDLVNRCVLCACTGVGGEEGAGAAAPLRL